MITLIGLKRFKSINSYCFHHLFFIELFLSLRTIERCVIAFDIKWQNNKDLKKFNNGFPVDTKLFKNLGLAI